jgi:hypothetical protein
MGKSWTPTPYGTIIEELDEKVAIPFPRRVWERGYIMSTIPPMVRCALCKKLFRAIYAHLRTHNISAIEYAQRFPNSLLSAPDISCVPTAEGIERIRTAVSASNRKRWSENREQETVLLDAARAKRTPEDMARAAIKQLTPAKKEAMRSSVVASNRKRWSENRGKELAHLAAISSVSKESTDLYQTLVAIFPDARLSAWDVLPGMEIDIWVPSLRLGIEYHGLYWHSEASPGYKHLSECHKYNACLKQGIRLIQVYSDDWQDRQKIFLDLISRLHPTWSGKRLYHLQPRSVSRIEAETFLNANHYLSGREVVGSLYVGLFSKDKLCAVSVFKRTGKPGEIDWTRHATLLGHFGWNLGQKCLDYAMEKLNPSRVVSFSDNRIHTGNMYQKLGFVNDGCGRPTYEYTDGRTRSHKFSKRVKKGTSETDLWPSEGWFRVYDSGKTKWVLDIPPKSTP